MTFTIFATRFAWRGAGGAWATVRSYIEGRSARLFERERRETYQKVPHVLPTGTRIYDKRADGSILEVSVPPALQLEVILDRGTLHSAGDSVDSVTSQPPITALLEHRRKATDGD